MGGGLGGSIKASFLVTDANMRTNCARMCIFRILIPHTNSNTPVDIGARMSNI